MGLWIRGLRLGRFSGGVGWIYGSGVEIGRFRGGFMDQGIEIGRFRGGNGWV